MQQLWFWCIAKVGVLNYKGFCVLEVIFTYGSGFGCRTTLLERCFFWKVAFPLSIAHAKPTDRNHQGHNDYSCYDATYVEVIYLHSFPRTPAMSNRITGFTGIFSTVHFWNSIKLQSSRFWIHCVWAVGDLGAKFWILWQRDAVLKPRVFRSWVAFFVLTSQLYHSSTQGRIGHFTWWNCRSH